MVADVLVQLKERVSDYELKAIMKVIEVWQNRQIYEDLWL